MKEYTPTDKDLEWKAGLRYLENGELSNQMLMAIQTDSPWHLKQVLEVCSKMRLLRQSNSPLCFAVDNGASAQVLKMLVDAGASAEALEAADWRALGGRGGVARLNVFFGKNTHLFDRDSYYDKIYPALNAAIYKERPRSVMFLLRAAKRHMPPEDLVALHGQVIFDIARIDNPAMLRLVEKCGVPVASSLNLLLQEAYERGKSRLIDALLERGADPHSCGRSNDEELARHCEAFTRKAQQAFEKFAPDCPIDAGFLRSAAEARALPRVAARLAANPSQPFDPADLAAKDAQGESALYKLHVRGDLAQIMNPVFWRGRTGALAALAPHLERLMPPAEAKLMIEAIRKNAVMDSLRRTAPPRRGPAP